MNTRETLVKIAELVSDLSGLIYEEDNEYTAEYYDAFPPEGEEFTYNELKELLEAVQKENANLMRQLAHRTHECKQLKGEKKKLKEMIKKLKANNQKLIDYIKETNNENEKS